MTYNTYIWCVWFSQNYGVINLKLGWSGVRMLLTAKVKETGGEGRAKEIASLRL